MQDGTTRASTSAGDTGEDFADIVARDVRRRATDAEREMLRRADMLEAWRDELTALRRRVDTQLATHRARTEDAQRECWAKGEAGKSEWFARRVELDTHRAKIIRFHEAVFAREREVRRLIRERDTAVRPAGVPRATILATLEELRAEVQDLRTQLAALHAATGHQAAEAVAHG